MSASAPVSVIRIDWMEHKSGWSANAPFWRHSQLPGFMSASRPIVVIPKADAGSWKLSLPEVDAVAP
jgi:hypothetical protein|tara:strand:- start:3996 stop:4196 length:201 start_codon:yes stop_codon:yes gene_type:complete